MKNQLSFKEAKRLSIIKWEAHASHSNGYNPFIKHDHRIEELLHGCGFCERNKKDIDYSFEKDCDKCEFGKIAGKCNDDNSLFNNWMIVSSGILKIKFAKDILEVIKSLNENS